MVNTQKGFSLVQLLIALSIITILSLVVFVAGDKSRAEARDTKRISELNQVAAALSAFQIDNGVFPSGSVSDSNELCSVVDALTCQGESTALPNFLTELIAGGYLSQEVRDPLNETRGDNYYYYTYVTNPSQTIAMVGVSLETDQELMENDGGLFSNLYEIKKTTTYTSSSSGGSSPPGFGFTTGAADPPDYCYYCWTE